MGARGFSAAVDGHVVNILPPQSISGGVSTTPFHLRAAAHASIIIQFGALAAAPGAITLNACTNNAGANPTPIGFNYYSQTTAGATNDVLSARSVATAAGFAPTDASNTFYVLEVQSDQIPSGNGVGTGEGPYLQLTFADGSNVDLVSAVAILSGLRSAGDSNPTATN